MNAPPPASPAHPVGRYVLERRIASGGMADVYLARQTGAYGFAKHVALKVLKRESAGDDEHVKMFIREALVAAEFRHPNLAQVYEVGEIEGRLFIAMELVRGVSVAALLKGLGAREKGMPLNVAVRIAIDTLEGLAHAHEAAGSDGKPLGLVHRDISPQNIMVGVDGAVKVVDFGIARVETKLDRTIAPKIKGKFAYMSPEQWEPRGGLDARADVFALGIVLYEMTTGGERLFKGDTPKDLYRSAVLDPILDPRSRMPEYPEALARIVMRALERGPNARWPSARAMRNALVKFAETEGWSMSQRGVADTVRAALGPGEIESRWEPVAETLSALGPSASGTGAHAAVDPNEANTMVERAGDPGVATATANAGEGASLPSPRVSAAPPLPPVGAALGTLGALLALAIAGVTGFALGRRAERSNARAAVSASAVPATSAGVPAVSALRVRAPDLLASGPGADALRAAWTGAHPEIALRFESARAGDAFSELLSNGADVAIALRGPSDEERARGTASGLDLGDAGRTVIGRAVAAVVVHPSNPIASLSSDRVRALLAGRIARWDDLGVPLGAVRTILRRPNDELTARVSAVVLDGASPPAGFETVETGAAASALVASDPHAVSVMSLGAAERAGTVRVVPVTGENPLAFPVVVVTRGAPRGAARAFVDWLRAPDVTPALRAAGIVRE